MTSIGRTKELHPMQGIGGFLKVSFFTMETTILPEFFPTYFCPVGMGI